MPSWRVLPAARRRTGEGEEGGGKFGTTTHGEEEEREKVGSSRECRSGRDTREKKRKRENIIETHRKEKDFSSKRKQIFDLAGRLPARTIYVVMLKICL